MHSKSPVSLLSLPINNHDKQLKANLTFPFGTQLVSVYDQKLFRTMATFCASFLGSSSKPTSCAAVLGVLEKSRDFFDPEGIWNCLFWAPTHPKHLGSPRRKTSNFLQRLQNGKIRQNLYFWPGQLFP